MRAAEQEAQIWKIDRSVYTGAMFQSTRERLIAAGARLMSENGYQGTGLAEILSAAGVPKGSFYHHFASKEAFAIEVLRGMADASARRLEEDLLSKTGSARDRLRNLVQHAIEYYDGVSCRHGSLLMQLGGEVSHNFPAIGEEIAADLRRLEQVWVAFAEDARRAGDIGAEYDPKWLGLHLFMLYEAAVAWMRINGETTPLMNYLEMVDRFLGSS